MLRYAEEKHDFTKTVNHPPNSGDFECPCGDTKAVGQKREAEGI